MAALSNEPPFWTSRYPELTPAQRARKSAYRLKKLAPFTYRKRVREGRLPKV